MRYDTSAKRCTCDVVTLKYISVDIGASVFFFLSFFLSFFSVEADLTEANEEGKLFNQIKSK